MKKLLLMTMMLGISIIFLPSRAQAQYRSPYIYSNNSYLNYALASARAKKARAAAARKSKSTVRKRKAAKRKVRRVSSVDHIENKLFWQKPTAKNANIV